MNCQLSNLNVIVQDVPRSLKFYTNVLGLHHAEREEPGGPLTMVLLEAGGCTLSLQAAEPGQTVSPASGVELGFVVEDVDAAWRELQAAGGYALTEPRELSFGRSFDARDPDGHRLVFFKFGQP